MKWLNAIGLLLQFLLFWLAAPELLGANTLKRLEQGLTRLISLIPLILILIVIAAYGLTFTIVGMIKGLKGATQGISQEEY